jgi:hypothetical protein
VDSQQVDLRERVVDLEDLGEVVHDLVAVVQRKISLLLQTASGVDPDGNVLSVVLALRVCLNILEISDSPCQKVCGHDR